MSLSKLLFVVKRAEFNVFIRKFSGNSINLPMKTQWKKLPSASKRKFCRRTISSPFEEQEFFIEVKQPALIQGKIVLVFGTDDVGKFFIKEFLQSGAKGVMVSDEQEQKGQQLIDELAKEFPNQQLAFIQSDYHNEQLIENAYNCTKNHFGYIDVVVNVAMKLNDVWSKIIDKNIKGILYSNMLAMRYMNSVNGGKGGTILNVIKTSVSDDDQCPVYLATRDFLIRFGKLIPNKMEKGGNVKILTLCSEKLVAIGGEKNFGLELDYLLLLAKSGSIWTT